MCGAERILGAKEFDVNIYVANCISQKFHQKLP